MSRRALVALFLLLAVGQARPLAAQQRDPAAARLIAEQLDPQLLRWDSVLAERGYHRTPGAEQVGASRSGETVVLDAELASGVSYALLAVCDNDCADLDLELIGPDGTSLGADTEVDSQPLVLHEATVSGSHRVRVAMVRCSNEPCWHSFAVYRREGGEVGSTASSSDGERVVVEESGTLRAGDARLESGEFVDRFEIEAAPGDTLVADLTSSEFDPYLYVRSPSGQQTDNDDWEGDATHARIELPVDEAGTWTVAATSFQPGESGAYRVRISVRAGAGRQSDGPRIETGRLEAGDETLQSGEYVDTYAVEAQAGERLVVDLRSSELDPYLMLIPPSGETVQNDDFEGDARRSVIAQDLTVSGTYRVAVTSYQPGETGAYTLRIEQGGDRADTGPRVERGTLAEGDETLQSGEYADVYRFQGSPGQTLKATVTSSAFDTYLIVRGPSADRQENDDLEGRPGESEVEMTLTESGEYRVIVTSYAVGETGAYALTVAQDVPTAVAQRRRDVEELRLGGSVSGTLEQGDVQLDGGEYRDLYVFEGQAGDAVQVRLTSEAFDTYVGVITPSGENVDNDDWDGSTRESRVELVLPESGRYRVFATSYQAGEAGPYSLSLQRGAPTAVAAATDGAPRRVLGVFVGISDYGGRANDLAYTAQDAHTVAGALQSGAGMRAQDAVILTDRDATRARVEAAVREIGGRAGPEDLFVFFYSGHGARQERSGPQPSDPDALDETLEFFDRGITDDEFSALLSEIAPGISMLVLDACFSGGFSKDVVSVPGRIGFFSSEEDVTSSVAAKFRAGGYLAHFVGDAVGEKLADADGDGAVSAIELSQYLYERYRSDVKSGGAEDFVRTGGPQTGYQHLVVDRGSIGPSRILFR
ncbi:MAG: caspase family protein [Gemmatimonadota bacterium]